MSVTFSIDSLGTGEFQFTCYGADSARTLGPFASREAGNAAVAEHAASCPDCGLYRPYVSEIQDIDREMNVSNMNAGLLFRTMGLESDLCGAMPAEEFLGYVLVALGSPVDDSGVSPSEHQVQRPDGSRGPTIIDCGLPAGYITQRLSTLADMATEAKRLGRDIVWG